MGADERSTELIVRAKNLSDAGFAAVTGNIQRLRGEVNTTTFGRLESSLRQFDDVLELAGGPHLRDAIQGFGQLQDAASGAAGKLDLLGKAGLVASAAMGGWQIGRKIAELTGSDKLIGDATARLLGWGDAAKESAAAGADVLARASKNAGRQITDMTEAVRINEEATKRAMDTIARNNAPAESARQLAAWRGEIEKLRSAGVLDGLQKDVESQNFSQKDLADRYRISSEAVSLFGRQLETGRKELEKTTKVADDHRKAIADLVDKLGGGGAVKAATDLEEALRKLPPVWQLTRDAQLEVAKTMEGVIAVYVAAGREVPAAWKRMAADAREGSFSLIQANEAVIKSMQLASISWAAPKTAGFEIKPTESFVGAVAAIDVEKVRQAAAKRVAEAFKGKFWKDVFGSPQQFGAGFGQALMGAIQGGGNVFNAGAGFIGQQLGEGIASELSASLTKKGASLFSKTLGGLVESVLPGLGTLLGPLTGKIASLIGGLFDRDKGRDSIKEWVQGVTGSSDLNALRGYLQKNLPSAEVEKYWILLTQGVGRNNAQQARAAIDEVTAAIERQKGALQANTADARVSLSDLVSIVERYGGTLDNLGPKAQALDITDKANQLLEDFKRVGATVGELGGFYNVTADEMNDLLKRAAETQTALPEALRPFAQEMANAGLLVDKTGEKLTDLSGLTWESSLTDKVGDLVDVMKDFVETIRDGAVPALESLGRVRIPTIRIPYEYEPGGFAGGTGGMTGTAPATAGGGGAGASRVPVQLVITAQGTRLLAQTVLEHEGTILGTYGAARA